MLFISAAICCFLFLMHVLSKLGHAEKRLWVKKLHCKLNFYLSFWFSSPIFFFFVFFKYLFTCFFRPFWLWQDLFNENVKDPQNIFRKGGAASWFLKTTFHSKQRHIFLQISLAYLTESHTLIQIWMLRCRMRRFATTIFSATQRSHIVASLFWMVTTWFLPTLQRSVALKIVVANRSV